MIGIIYLEKRNYQSNKKFKKIILYHKIIIIIIYNIKQNSIYTIIKYVYNYNTILHYLFITSCKEKLIII